MAGASPLSLSWSLRPILVVLLLAATMAGCLGGERDVEAPTPAPEALATTAFSHYIHTHSTPMEGVTFDTVLVEQYRVAAPDGTLLDTWILRPEGATDLPLVLEVTPYYPGGPPVFDAGIDDPLYYGIYLLAHTMLEHGYAFGISSVRGTGNSEGCFTQGGPTEGQDTAAVIEHLAAQPWSNGHVGLIGVSYPGTTPQQVWLEAPPALKTIVPISGISDFYKYNFANGVPIFIQGYGFNAYYYALVGALPSDFPMGHTLLDPASVPGRVIGQVCAEQADVQSAGVQATVDGNKAPYWQARDFAKIHRDTWDRNPERASVFFIHGLQDWNVKPHHMEEWLEQIQDSGVPYKVWLGQWGHAWPNWREDWWNVTVVAWFDEFLKGMETGILDAPAVQVQDDALRWRHEAHWPPRTADLLTLHPTPDGRLANTTQSGTVTYHDHMGGLLFSTIGAAVVGPRQVIFDSAPLEADILLTGQPRIIIDATATGKRASLMLTLQEVKPDGSTRNIGYAVQSLNHASDIANGDSDISGKRIHVDLRFFPLDSHVAAGSSLRLMAADNIALSFFTPATGVRLPLFLPISDGSEITLHLDDARLELPYQATGTLVFEDPQPCWENTDRCGENPS